MNSNLLLAVLLSVSICASAVGGAIMTLLKRQRAAESFLILSVLMIIFTWLYILMVTL